MDKANNVVMMKSSMLLLVLNVTAVANVSKNWKQLYMSVVQILNVLVLHTLLMLVFGNIKQDTNSSILLLLLVKYLITDTKVHIKKKN